MRWGRHANSLKVLRNGLVFLWLLAVVCPQSAEALPHEASCPAELEGKIVSNISISIDEVFDQQDAEWAYRQVNKLKTSTEREIVSRELLFKEGEPLECFKLQETERVLRSIGYLRRVRVTPKLEKDPSSGQELVTVSIVVQDTWTLVPQIGYSSGSGKKTQTAGLAESNLLGRGKRLEGLYREEDGRTSLQGVYVDPRIWGSDQSLLLAYLDRNDGNQMYGSLSNPIRSLLDTSSWDVDVDHIDAVGRFFEDGSESYIYRQNRDAVVGRYTWIFGNPEKSSQRYSVGYGYSDETFSQATQQDYDDLNLEPGTVSNDPARLANARRFSGPLVTYEHIEPFFISRNFIDRFAREQDFNLGRSFFANLQAAPSFLGSKDSAVLFSGNYSAGSLIDADSFIRGEIGYSGRLQSGEGVINNLPRLQLRYFNVLGLLTAGGWNLGRHTFAAGLNLDYGYKLDKDREFSLGADNSLRGYSAHSFNGNRALSVNIEDRIHIVEDVFHLIDIGAAVFTDVGGVSNNAIGSLLSDDLYADVGIGLRIGFPRSSGGKIVRIDLAAPLRDGPDGSNALEIRVLFAGGNILDGLLRSEQVGAERANISVGFDK